MKKLAQILSQFKSYSQCINAYIEQGQMTPYGGKDIFIGIVPMCPHHYEIIKKVFASTQQVMSKFISNFYQLKLRHQKYQKKPTQRFQELKRDMQVLVGTRANINIAQIEDYGGEAFLSEELAIKMLQEVNAALKKCHLLCNESDLPANVIKLNDILFRFLMHENVNYALELGLHAVPIVESTRTLPQLYFLDVVKCLDRTINAVIGWAKLYLQNEQKKTDYKPDTDVDDIVSGKMVKFKKTYYTNLAPIIAVAQKSQEADDQETKLGRIDIV
uniref:Exocyst complex component Sec10-like alpha-helical bundle domain-containing protein n=1 Tax=Glossina pallidipes TaxID=7398 RepID=A0A1B0AIQ2_GLOPL